MARALAEVAVATADLAQPQTIGATQRSERHLDADGIADQLVEIGELVTPVATDPDEADDDDYVLVDEQIDIDQIVRDAIGVEMPFAPLCRPDCRGLCPTCGGNRNLGECPGHEALDPRFAVLADLLPDLPDID